MDKIDSEPIPIIILAAGSSSRMGQSKQLLLIQGKPLLRKIAEEGLAIENSFVVVVLGANASHCSEVLKGLPTECVFNECWQNGMGSSLKVGVKYATEKIPAAKKLLVLVCDQPFITNVHLKKMLEAWRVGTRSIIASAYAGVLGVPCLFGNQYFSEIEKLNDNEGARKLIQLFPTDVEAVEFPNGEVDLDTPEDYAFIQKLLNS